MKKYVLMAMFTVLYLAVSHNAKSQILRNISKKIEKKAEEVISQSIDSFTTSETVDDKNETQSINNTINQTGPFKNIGFLPYDFKRGSEIIFQDNFSDEIVGKMASRWTSNGLGTVTQVPGFTGNFLKLFDGNTYKIKELIKIPERFTLEFDVILIAEKGKNVSLDFGFDYEKGVGKHYYLAYKNPINMQASYRFDKIEFSSNEVEPVKISKIEANMSYFVNDVMKVKILVDGDQMSTYINEIKILDTEMVNKTTKKYLYIAVENEKNLAEVFLGNIILSKL